MLINSRIEHLENNSVTLAFYDSPVEKINWRNTTILIVPDNINSLIKKSKLRNIRNRQNLF